MKIIGVRNSVHEKLTPFDYLARFRDSLSETTENVGNLDMAVGSDYALAGYDLLQTFDFSIRNDVLARLKDISKNFKNTLIIPGTSPWRSNKNQMFLSAPIFKKGRKIRELYKETSRGETESAELLGLEYDRGNADENVLFSNGKVIPVEICSDHGHQEIPEDTYLEVVLAYDRFAGFSPRPNFNVSRYFLVNDHESGNILCGKYNADKGMAGTEIIKPIVKTKTYEVFEIKD